MAERRKSEMTRTRITRATIIENWDFLKRNINLQRILGSLIQNKVLTLSQYGRIQNKKGETQAQAFLDILKLTDDFQNFHQSLIDSDNSGIVDVLEGRTDCQDYKRKRTEVEDTRETTGETNTDERLLKVVTMVENLYQQGQLNHQQINQRFDRQEQNHHQQMKTIEESHQQQMMKIEENHQRQMKMLSEKYHSLEEEITGIKQYLSEYWKDGNSCKENIDIKLKSKCQQCKKLQEKNDLLQQELRAAMRDSDLAVELKEKVASLTAEIEDMKNESQRSSEVTRKNLTEIRDIYEQELLQLTQQDDRMKDAMRSLIEESEKKETVISECRTKIEDLLKGVEN